MNSTSPDEPIVVILCTGNADQCWPVEDPADATGTEARQIEIFRRVRDHIRQFFEAYGRGRVDGGPERAQ